MSETEEIIRRLEMKKKYNWYACADGKFHIWNNKYNAICGNKFSRKTPKVDNDKVKESGKMCLKCHRLMVENNINLGRN